MSCYRSRYRTEHSQDRDKAQVRIWAHVTLLYRTLFLHLIYKLISCLEKLSSDFLYEILMALGVMNTNILQNIPYKAFSFVRI